MGVVGLAEARGQQNYIVKWELEVGKMKGEGDWNEA